MTAGTRVKGRISGRLGVVQKHVPNRLGTFPVAFNDGLWEICGADDVTVIAAPGEKPASAA